MLLQNCHDDRSIIGQCRLYHWIDLEKLWPTKKKILNRKYKHKFINFLLNSNLKNRSILLWCHYNIWSTFWYVFFFVKKIKKLITLCSNIRLKPFFHIFFLSSIDSCKYFFVIISSEWWYNVVIKLVNYSI